MKNRFMLLVLSLLFIVSIFSFDNISDVNVRSHQYYDENEVTEEVNKLEQNNKDLFERIKKLEELAQNYITSRNVPANKTELCLQYLRRDRYGNDKWTGLLGPVDGSFVDYVESYGYDLKFTETEVLYDLGNNRAIDFIHMVAVLNSYVRYGDKIPLVITSLSTDYAGWAGDSLTFLEEMVKYRIENTPSAEILENESEEAKQLRSEKYLEHVISYLGTNKTSTMSGPDVYADFDAYNIYHDNSLKVKESFYEALVSYYDTYAGNSNAGNRFSVLQSKFGSTEESISNYVRPYLTNTVVRKLFIPDTTDKVIDEDINVFLKAFSKYIIGDIYIEIENYNKDATVGEEIKLKVIENHLDYSKINVVPEKLAEAKLNGEYLTITPKQAGVAEIIVSDLGESVSKIYKLKINNVKPKIEIGLDSSYYFNENESTTIEVDAVGTNNVYTWYMSDLKNGDYKVLSETTTPSYALTATKDMDGKFIKCGIKNDGNEEIFTNISVVHVASSRMEMFLKKNNSALYIGLGIIVLILLIIVFVYFNFIKGKDKDPLKKIWEKKDKKLDEVEGTEDVVTEGNAQENEGQEKTIIQEQVQPQTQVPIQNPQPGPMNTIDLFSHVGVNPPNNNDINKMG